jgi:autotransporter-associated beta strand protein
LNKTSTADIHAAANLTVASEATVQYTGAGDYQVWGGGAITLAGGTLDFNGHTQLGTSLLVQDAGSVLANTSSTTAVYSPSSATLSTDLVVSAVGTLDLNGPITANDHVLWKNGGDGMLRLSGTASNTSLTTVNYAGTLQLAKAAGAIAADAAFAMSGGTVQYATADNQLPASGVLIAEGGVVDFNGRSQSGTELRLSDQTDGSTLANLAVGTTSTYAPTRVLTITRNFTVNTAGDLHLTAGLACNNANWPGLSKVGSGQLYLDGAADNTFLTVHANEGTTVLAKENTSVRRHAAVAVSVAQGATVRYAGSGNYQVAPGNWIQLYGGTLDLNGRTQAGIDFYSQTAGSILANTHSAAATLNPTSFTLNADLNVDTMGDMTISGPIAGVGGLTKNGLGTLTLTRANTFSGRTTINNGALRIAVEGSLNASSNGITVNSGGTLLVNSTSPLTRSLAVNGGTLGGTGQYLGNLTLGSGHLSPGDGGVGTMTQQGSLTLDAAAVLDFDLGSTAGVSDRWAFDGAGRNLILDGTLNIASSGSIADGSYVLFSGATSITDNGIELGSVPTSHKWSYAIQQHSGYYDIVLTATPEPGTVVLLTMALMSLVAYNWKRGRTVGQWTALAQPFGERPTEG